MYESVDRLSNIVTGLSMEQKVVSNNIANTHTPGYVRQEYKFADVLGRLDNPFETTLSQKMGSMASSNFIQDNGRPVDLAREMVEMQKISLNYTMVTRRVSTVFNNIRRATQVGR